MAVEYKPTFASFICSSLYGFTPVITAGIIMYFLADSAKLITWILSGIMVAFSLILFLQAIFVHLRKFYLDEVYIRNSGLFSTNEMRWSDIVSAELRERENLISRTDRVLVFTSYDNIIVFNISTLRREDEKSMLDLVRKKTNLVSRKDKPTI